MSTVLSTAGGARGRWTGLIFRGFLFLSLAVGVSTLSVLLGQVLLDSQGYLDTTLLTNPPSTFPNIAGARPAILASLYLTGLVFLFAVPVGVATAIYLEEYANRERWYNRLLELNIQNLAGVPSIVYGILGLAFLVHGVGLGRTLLAGALILDAAGAADRDHRVARGAALGAAVDPRRRVRVGRDPLAGDMAPGASGRDSRHRNRLDPRPLAGDRGDGAAAACGGTRLCALRSDADTDRSPHCPYRSSTGSSSRRMSSSSLRLPLSWC